MVPLGLIFWLLYSATAWANPVEPRVLLLHGGNVPFSHRYFSSATKKVQSHRIETETHPVGAEIEYYTEENKGKFSAVVISDYTAYAEMEEKVRVALDHYCRNNQVGQFFLYVTHHSRLNGSDILTSNHHEFPYQDTLNAPDVQKLSKANKRFDLKIWGRYLNVQSGEGYRPLVNTTAYGDVVTSVLLDEGKHDGIRRVFFGLDFEKHWFQHLLLIDALEWLSPVDFGISRTRYIGVDIDDIFLFTPPKEGGIKLFDTEVRAILENQKKLSEIMGKPFRYQVGYNSDGFAKTLPDSLTREQEVAGDKEWLKLKNHFDWFDHLPVHEKSDTYTLTGLEYLMGKSKKFAEQFELTPLIGRYHVSPFHNGIFPPYDTLYTAWKNVWDAKYTSTVYTKEAFEHNGIKVAPRTDLALAYHVYAWDMVDRDALETGANGGFLFRRIVFNPVSIIMTHQANFARDQIAQHVMEKLVSFIKDSTNIELVNLPSDQLVAKHFELGAPRYLTD